MFLTLPPAPDLAPLVAGYWFIQDLPSEFEGKPIRTTPLPFAVLSVNIGRPNAAEDGSLVPSASLLGLQCRSRSWRSWADTYFVMVMLTPEGVARLFPNSGGATAGRLLDIGDILGDAAASSLANGIGFEHQPCTIAALLDRWLASRLANAPLSSDASLIAAAQKLIFRGCTIQAVAEALGVGRRQLHRSFHRHLGMGPKGFADLSRLHTSLRRVQTSVGDPLEGFSDQAHQIRTWRQKLGVTPGAYARAVRSPLAAHFSLVGTRGEIEDTPAFYL